MLRLEGRKLLLFPACIVMVTLAPAQAAPPASSLHGPSFVPETSMSASGLSGWHTLGQAKWHAQTGEIVADGTTHSGWLVLDKSLQDTGFYTAFRCSEPCETGVLLRMAKTENGFTGTYLSLKGGELEADRVTLSAEGDIVSREKLRDARGQFRFAPSQSEPTALLDPVREQAAYDVPASRLPVTRTREGFRNGAWNELEVLLDENVMRGYLNDTSREVSAATADDDLEAYGQLALFVGKGSNIHFKSPAYKDIAMRVQPPEEVGSRFRIQRLSPFYYNWTATAADFNHSGKLDIVSGAYMYFAPDYTRSREIYPARSFNPSTEYSVWVQHSYDFTGDGWSDVIATNLGHGAVLYVNPGGASRRWKQYRVIPSMESENSLLADVDGDGKPELVYTANGYMRYASPDPKNPTGLWIVHSISERAAWPAHGIGVGDINGDGRMDIVGADGWWEQPASLDSQKPWKYHPEAFGRWGRIGPGGATMGIYDINGDGLPDVVTGLEAHGFGLAWFEQKRAPNGDISFVKHMVMDNYNTQNAGNVVFSELHGSGIADIDGDGIPDFVVGKRQFSHKDDFLDPDVYGPPLLYWYKTVRDPKAEGGARLVPQLIHNNSGAGDNLLTVDLNGDGAIDIVSATKRGLFIFWGQPGQPPASK